jgi:hypothetical protein
MQAYIQGIFGVPSSEATYPILHRIDVLLAAIAVAVAVMVA